MGKDTTKHKWVGRPGIPSVWANFQGDSRASFADYTGEGKVVTISPAYSSVTTSLVYPSVTTSLVYPSVTTSLVYISGVGWSHQRPAGAERFLGRYSAEERFLGRLWRWRLGDLDPRLRGDSERRAGSSHSESGISNTTGSRSAWLTAAASGRAASISRRMGSTWMGLHRAWPQTSSDPRFS